MSNDYKDSRAVKINNWLNVANEIYFATRVEHSGSITLIKIFKAHSRSVYS